MMNPLVDHRRSFETSGCGTRGVTIRVDAAVARSQIWRMQGLLATDGLAAIFRDCHLTELTQILECQQRVHALLVYPCDLDNAYEIK